MTIAERVVPWNDSAVVWDGAIDRVVIEMLSNAGRVAPPVDAIVLAAALRVEIAFDRRQSERGRFQRLDGQPAIFLKPDDRIERLQWAAAHELGEFSAARICREADADLDDVTPHLREQLANWFAARLLLPTVWFASDAERRDGDLFLLKSRYATASHELIAMRLLDLEWPAVVSVFDQCRLTRRRSNLSAGTPPLQPVERRAHGDAHFLGVPVELRHGALRSRAWPIHEPGWKREIVVTTLVGEEGIEN